MTKNDAFKEKWMLRKTISYLFHNPDEVILAEGLWNGRIFEVRDKKRCGKLAKAIQLLNGTKTVEQIIDEIKDMNILNLIEELKRNGLLIKVEDAADREPTAFELFFGFSEDKLRQISPLIIGDGQLGQILAHQLSLMNIESRLNRTSDVNDSLLKENSYIVVLSENQQPYFYNLINDLCLKRRIKWTLGLFDGAYAVISTFIPFETACYVCFEHRIESTLPIYQMDSYLRFKRSLSSCDLIRQSIPPIFAEMVAAFIAVEVIKVIGYGAGDYSGVALFFIRVKLSNLVFSKKIGKISLRLNSSHVSFLSIVLPLAEDFLWRGVLTTFFTGLGFPKVMALALSAVSFGTIHYYFGKREILFKSFEGLFYGALFLASESFIASGFAHIVYNHLVHGYKRSCNEG